MRLIGWLLQSVLNRSARFRRHVSSARLPGSHPDQFPSGSGCGAQREWSLCQPAFSDPPITILVTSMTRRTNARPTSDFSSRRTHFRSHARIRTEPRRGDTERAKRRPSSRLGAVENGEWLQYHFLDALVFQLITSRASDADSCLLRRPQRPSRVACGKLAGGEKFARLCLRPPRLDVYLRRFEPAASPLRLGTCGPRYATFVAPSS